MKGYIRERGENTYQIFVERPRGPGGKRRRATYTVRGTLADAEAKRQEILGSIDEDTFIEPRRMRLSVWLQQWLKDQKANLTPRTLQRYEEIVRHHLSPALGNIKLSALRPTHIRSYYTQAIASGRRDGKGGLSTTTVLQHHNVLRKALQDALLLGEIDDNPADRVSNKPRARGHQVRPLTSEVQRQVLDAVSETRFWIPVMLALATGMRRGEILGLRWKDVDLDQQVISIRHSLSVTKAGIELKPPKTKGSRRSVALPRYAVESLRKHRVEQAKNLLHLGPLYDNQDFLCPRPDGRPWNPDEFSSNFRRLLISKKLPLFRFHDLRHTHATMLMELNLHPKVVSDRLGHSKIGITIDLYSHITRGLQREAADKLDELHRSTK